MLSGICSYDNKIFINGMIREKANLLFYRQKMTRQFRVRAELFPFQPSERLKMFERRLYRIFMALLEMIIKLVKPKKNTEVLKNFGILAPFLQRSRQRPKRTTNSIYPNYENF